jgi:hypothetical protein
MFQECPPALSAPLSLILSLSKNVMSLKEGSHINVFEEWMPGGSLSGLLDKHGPFTESVILR